MTSPLADIRLESISGRYIGGRRVTARGQEVIAVSAPAEPTIVG